MFYHRIHPPRLTVRRHTLLSLQPDALLLLVRHTPHLRYLHHPPVQRHLLRRLLLLPNLPVSLNLRVRHRDRDGRRRNLLPLPLPHRRPGAANVRPLPRPLTPLMQPSRTPKPLAPLLLLTPKLPSSHLRSPYLLPLVSLLPYLAWLLNSKRMILSSPLRLAVTTGTNLLVPDPILNPRQAIAFCPTNLVTCRIFGWPSAISSSQLNGLRLQSQQCIPGIGPDHVGERGDTFGSIWSRSSCPILWL